MTSLEHLLPAADQSVRCADHSRNLGVDPGGTAIRADRVILIETPLPWPKPVFGHALLAEIHPILKESVLPTRILAAVPPADAESNGESPYPTVISFDRHDDGVIERRFNVRTPEQLVGLAQALAANDLETIDVMADRSGPLGDAVLLVCTQGSHDVCCGSEGARFAAEAEAIAGLAVYRVSHTGGHRFAPTAMTLPDGRMWADLDLDLLRQVLSRTGDTADVIDRCRGWWGADTGPAQMAERAVFALTGWDFDDTVRSLTMPSDEAERADGTVQCTVAAEERAWRVDVGVGRTVPTIACREPGGLPAKPSTEYTITNITEIDAR